MCVIRYAVREIAVINGRVLYHRNNNEQNILYYEQNNRYFFKTNTYITIRLVWNKNILFIKTIRLTALI